MASTGRRFSGGASAKKASTRSLAADRAERSSTSPPSLVRRYEARRKLAKSRTASCSSSDASDDDNGTVPLSPEEFRLPQSKVALPVGRQFRRFLWN